MKILIFGGNRFVGRALTEELIPGNNVTLFNRTGTGPDKVEIIKGDRNNVSDIEQIDFSSYNLVIDFCLFKADQFKILSKYIPKNKPYIFISSASVGRKQWGEYGTDKEGCETLVKSHFTDFCIVRPPYIDGENSHRPRTAQIINQIQNNQPVTIAGDGNYYINITWVDDVVRFLNRIVFRKINGKQLGNEIIELSNPRNFLMNEYVETIAKFLNKDFTIESDSDKFWAPAYDLDMMYNMYTDEFQTISNKLPSFLKWFNEKGKNKYGY